MKNRLGRLFSPILFQSPISFEIVGCPVQPEILKLLNSLFAISNNLYQLSYLDSLVQINCSLMGSSFVENITNLSSPSGKVGIENAA